jgi:hypothetical protein
MSARGRYALRKDTNQPDIVDAQRSIGASVKVMHEPLDLLVGLAGKTYLLECKQASKRGRKNEKTPAQQKFINEWRGHYAIVYSPAEAIEAVLGVT